MRILVVLAHPLADSFAASVARETVEGHRAKGHDVDLLDLYAEGFDPVLSVAERGSYFSEPFDDSAVRPLIERIKSADGLVLVFPQWWFNMPAIMKGFIDRVFAPGSAFAMDPATQKLIPGLGNLRFFHVLTTTGSKWWVVKFYMGDPVRRILKRGVVAFCCPQTRFRMISLHDMDHPSEAKFKAHLDRVRRLAHSV
ncbi:NAD(P)H-dependent oxidoreductase [Rhizobium alvei]|uniref:NAD(P)H-dependent oxidoreductase n=1 Tax=Rhizobium alvei TaxID=1132659 RepID=A0ABT8YPC1_9HYPH|nr:NAD(P)H-dependent oxidoreductase [Rhizobium alvei]MDO6965507.1 NAD(P)H-dependent oxidoreductase [Rhizobium alvei]